MREQEILAGMAHEIKNPLATMHGFLQLLAERVEGDTRSEYYVEMLSSELRRLEELVEDGLSFGRIRATPFSYCDLTEIMNKIATRANRLAKERNIRIKVKAVSCLQVEVAPKLLQQLLWNLVNNALAAVSRNGEILLELRQVSDNWLQLSCQDTGTGIPPSVLPEIFRPYFTTKKSGTGLGLPLCRQIAELHGGRLEVKSKLGSGTTFTLWLPISRDQLAKQES